MKQAVISEVVVSDTIDVSVPRLDANDFNSQIANYGYNVLLEKSVKCPCRAEGSLSARGTCISCNGFGFVYLDKISTRAIVQSLNKPFEIQNWTEASKGLVQITARYSDRISLFDRITLTDVSTIFTQHLDFFEQNGKYVAFCTYKPLEIEKLLMFESEDRPLIELQQADYSVSGAKITLSKPKIVQKALELGLRFSIRYSCNPQYMVFDIPRDMMMGNFMNCSSDFTTQDFPIKAMGRQLHALLELQS